MRESRSASVESSRSAVRDALIALVRLLARQAARDFASHTPESVETAGDPK
jgi:hypothetical protein